jgi:hypothetical protein
VVASVSLNLAWQAQKIKAMLEKAQKRKEKRFTLRLCMRLSFDLATKAVHAAGIEAFQAKLRIAGRRRGLNPGQTILVE